MIVPWLLLAGVFGPPLFVIALAAFDRNTPRLRSVAISAASCALAAGLASSLLGDAYRVRIGWPWPHNALTGPFLLQVSELSSPLIALVPSLWLLTVAVTPASRLDRAGLRRTAAATLSTTLAFSTDSPLVIASCWIVSSIFFMGGLASPGFRPTRRLLGGYLHASSALFCLGVGLATLATDPLVEDVGLAVIMLAVLIRKGIFPFHAWIPQAFDTGRVGPVVLFSAPQLGTYAAATIVVPHAADELLRAVAVLSLGTAAYAAALAVVQRDARRATGYLFVSQSALVLAGLDCTTPEALAGALVLWLSSALAFAGLARTVLALEARRGRLDLGKHHGGFEQMPLLATGFLVLGLACTGFPGTLGFVGQELLVDGAIRDFPTLGFLTVAASALTGLAVLRMYFSLFCGARVTDRGLGLRRRETVVFGAVAVFVILSGLAPTSIVASRASASASILHRRATLGTGR